MSAAKWTPRTNASDAERGDEETACCNIGCAQQRRFNAFRKQFNNERPHEALDYQTPSQVYFCSARLYPNVILDMEYESHFLVRTINHSGDMSWRQGRVFVSRIPSGERVGLLQIAEDRYRVFYGPMVIGEFDESQYLFCPRRVFRPV